MADMHTPLKPCPHCAGEAKDGYHEAYSTDSSFSWIGCGICEATIPYHREQERLSAVETWNRRTPSHDAETIKALEAKLTAIRNKIPMNYLRRHDVDGATGPTSECDIVAAMADYSADRWKYIDRVAAAEKSAKAMREALDECEAYFDNRSDVSDGDYGIPEPNEEMRLLTMVRSAQERAV